MSKEELDALTIWMEALIDLKFEELLGRDYTTEYLREAELKRELLTAFGIGGEE